MKSDLLFSSVLIIGIISVFISGYLLDEYFGIGLFRQRELQNNIFILPAINQSHKCFKLYGNTSYFRSVVVRVSTNKNTQCRLIVNEELGGRLGNQLFEIAAVVGMASELDMIPVINVKNSVISRLFYLPNTMDSKTSKFNAVKCNEKGYAKYSNCLKQFETYSSGNIMVSGYRQSWKYFKHSATYIRNVFSFNERLKQKAKSFIASSSVFGYGNVCIHVRRGDKMEPSNLAKGSSVADMDYISKAMQYFKSKYLRVKFIVLSDDMKWCKRNIKGDVTYSPYSEPGVDLAIMRYCDHAIVTSGTFGWWGAWLANGTVVYYHGFPRNGSFYSQGLSYEDYYPPNWIKL